MVNLYSFNIMINLDYIIKQAMREYLAFRKIQKIKEF